MPPGGRAAAQARPSPRCVNGGLGPWVHATGQHACTCTLRARACAYSHWQEKAVPACSGCARAAATPEPTHCSPRLRARAPLASSARCPTHRTHPQAGVLGQPVLQWWQAQCGGCVGLVHDGLVRGARHAHRRVASACGRQACASGGVCVRVTRYSSSFAEGATPLGPHTPSLQARTAACPLLTPLPSSPPLLPSARSSNPTSVRHSACRFTCSTPASRKRPSICARRPTCGSQRRTCVCVFTHAGDAHLHGPAHVHWTWRAPLPCYVLPPHRTCTSRKCFRSDSSSSPS